MRLWRSQNPEKVSVINKASRNRHLEARRANDRAYYEANRSKRLLDMATYRLAHPEIGRALKKKYRAANPLINLKDQLRRRVLGALARAKAGKAGRTFELIGCTPQFLKEYLESKFKQGMSWANRKLWHIDHAIPCAAFDLTDPQQQRACFNYKNLQPLWAMENLRKGERLWTEYSPAG
jgi:Prasinovirus endonuclease VII